MTSLLKTCDRVALGAYEDTACQATLSFVIVNSIAPTLSQPSSARPAHLGLCQDGSGAELGEGSGKSPWSLHRTLVSLLKPRGEAGMWSGAG